MNPIRSSLPSSSWLVATVVPWLTAVIAFPSRPSCPSTLRTPLRKPSAGSAGVDGVFVVLVCPDSSSTATTSVNVPPVSIPMRTRRALMADTLGMRYRRRKGRRLRLRCWRFRGSAETGGATGGCDDRGVGRRPGDLPVVALRIGEVGVAALEKLCVRGELGDARARAAGLLDQFVDLLGR